MKRKNVYLASFLGLTILMITISKSYGSNWEHKTQCFDTINVPITELFFSQRNIVWDEESRSKLHFNRWHVPKITPLNNLDGEYEEMLRNLGVEGYIDTSSTLTSEKPWFTEDMEAILNGDLIIKTYSKLDQFIASGKTIVVVPVKINERLFVLPDFFVSDFVISTIQASDCYEANSSFKMLRE